MCRRLDVGQGGFCVVYHVGAGLRTVRGPDRAEISRAARGYRSFTDEGGALYPMPPLKPSSTRSRCFGLLAGEESKHHPWTDGEAASPESEARSKAWSLFDRVSLANGGRCPPKTDDQVVSE